MCSSDFERCVISQFARSVLFIDDVIYSIERHYRGIRSDEGKGVVLNGTQVLVYPRYTEAVDRSGIRFWVITNSPSGYTCVRLVEEL